jgi:hypothetical protein
MLREVQLKPESEGLYPSLSPGRWYTAAAIAGLVRGSRIVREGAGVQFNTRILDPAHFEFRGGHARRGSRAGMRSRRLDRRPARQHSPHATLLAR